MILIKIAKIERERQRKLTHMWHAQTKDQTENAFLTF